MTLKVSLHCAFAPEGIASNAKAVTKADTLTGPQRNAVDMYPTPRNMLTRMGLHKQTPYLYGTESVGGTSPHCFCVINLPRRRCRCGNAAT